MESILIIDDDIQLSDILKEELREVGYTAEAKYGAVEGLDYLKNNKIDLLLLDLNMPEKDGFYVLELLAAEKNPVKIIVLTAYADIGSAIRSAKLGASDFITKPYDLDELLISIRKVLHM
ncbi:MAG: response regulator [Ignavibacteriaceae bacterium]|nr:response regulator [Ignavibacteriaceae bacterium]